MVMGIRVEIGAIPHATDVGAPARGIRTAPLFLSVTCRDVSGPPSSALSVVCVAAAEGAGAAVPPPRAGFTASALEVVRPADQPFPLPMHGVQGCLYDFYYCTLQALGLIDPPCSTSAPASSRTPRLAKDTSARTDSSNTVHSLS